MDSISEALEKAITSSHVEGEVAATLELVMSSKSCDECCFAANSCLVRGILPCTGGYWRVSSK